MTQGAVAFLGLFYEEKKYMEDKTELIYKREDVRLAINSNIKQLSTIIEKLPRDSNGIRHVLLSKSIRNLAEAYSYYGKEDK